MNNEVNPITMLDTKTLELAKKAIEAELTCEQNYKEWKENREALTVIEEELERRGGENSEQ